MYNADPDYTIGGELITDTAAHTGRFKSIFCGFIISLSYENSQNVFKFSEG